MSSSNPDYSSSANVQAGRAGVAPPVYQQYQQYQQYQPYQPYQQHEGYQAMPASPVAVAQPVAVAATAPPPPFAPQGQPMMYAAAPVPTGAPVAGAVYAQPIYGQPVSGEHVVLVNHHQPAAAPLGMFTDGLFDCFSDGSSCLLATCCRPIRWGLSVRRAGMLSLVAGIFLYGLVFWGESVATTLFQMSCSSNSSNDNGNNYDGTTNNNDDNSCRATTATYVFIILAIACVVARIVIGTVYRGKIREQHQIPGSSLEDCCIHTWCGCCAVAQEARHVDRVTGYLPMPQAHVYQQFNH